MKSFSHYRHATSIIEIENKKILIDPVFASKGSYPAIIHTKNPKKNPLVNLPVDYSKLLDVDGVIITHNHNDHFDELAKKVLPKNLPILCQKEDFLTFKSLGYLNLTSIDSAKNWLGLKCKGFLGYHGGHLLKSKLGVSSSFLITSSNSKVFITGDTLLTRKQKKLIKEISPDTIVAYGGGARMKLLGKLTMNNKDIIRLSKICKSSRIIVTHMEAINHCFDSRSKLINHPLLNNVIIPSDGETLTFSAL